MDFFLTNSFIVAGIIFGIGIIVAPIIRNVWLIRILIASYISLSFIFLIPDSFVFNVFANIIYFFAIVTILVFTKSNKFFDVPLWHAGRFSFESIGLSVLIVWFIIAIICNFVPFVNLSIFITRGVYDFLNVYIFYIAIMPLVFLTLVSNRMRT